MTWLVPDYIGSAWIWGGGGWETGQNGTQREKHVGKDEIGGAKKEKEIQRLRWPNLSILVSDHLRFTSLTRPKPGQRGCSFASLADGPTKVEKVESKTGCVTKVVADLFILDQFLFLPEEKCRVGKANRARLGRIRNE